MSFVWVRRSTFWCNNCSPSKTWSGLTWLSPFPFPIDASDLPFPFGVEASELFFPFCIDTSVLPFPFGIDASDLPFPFEGSGEAAAGSGEAAAGSGEAAFKDLGRQKATSEKTEHEQYPS